MADPQKGRLFDRYRSSCHSCLTAPCGGIAELPDDGVGPNSLCQCQKSDWGKEQ